MNKITNIFIVGPMGAGKSTVGQQVARALGRNFYDTDREIEKRSGVTLDWVFDVEGEEGFCQRETAVLQELVCLSNIILSTGGGTILLPQNRQLLRTHGNIIHLTTNLQQQITRTARNKYKRPTLRGEETVEKIKYFSEEREPLYEEISDVAFFSNHYNVSQVVKEILKFIEEAGW